MDPIDRIPQEGKPSFFDSIKQKLGLNKKTEKMDEIAERLKKNVLKKNAEPTPTLKERFHTFKKEMKGDFKTWKAGVSILGSKKPITKVKTTAATPQTEEEKREVLLGALNSVVGLMLAKLEQQVAEKETNREAQIPEGLFRVTTDLNIKNSFINALKDYDKDQIDQIIAEQNKSETSGMRQVEIENLGGFLKGFAAVINDETEYAKLFASPEDKAKLHEALKPLPKIIEIILKHHEDTKFTEIEHFNTAIISLISLQNFVKPTAEAIPFEDRLKRSGVAQNPTSDKTDTSLT
jgi:hypothetical protein